MTSVSPTPATSHATASASVDDHFSYAWTTAAFVVSVGALYAVLAPLWAYQVRAMDPRGEGKAFWRPPSASDGWVQALLGIVLSSACLWTFVKPAFARAAASDESAEGGGGSGPVFLPRGGSATERHVSAMRAQDRPRCGFAS